jgi:hypothetical protein
VVAARIGERVAVVKGAFMRLAIQLSACRTTRAGEPTTMLLGGTTVPSFT